MSLNPFSLFPSGVKKPPTNQARGFRLLGQSGYVRGCNSKGLPFGKRWGEMALYESLLCKGPRVSMGSSISCHVIDPSALVAIKYTQHIHTNVILYFETSLKQDTL